MKHFLIIFACTFCFATGKGQYIDKDSRTRTIIDKVEFLNLRTDSNTYTCSISPFDNGENPNFFDERHDKLESFLVNPKTNEKVSLASEHDKYKLEINFDSITLNQVTMSIEFSGFVGGGWYGAGSQVHVYIGEKIDTVTYIHLSPSLEATIYYNGKKLTKSIIVDTFPSFQMKNYIHSITEVGYDDHKQRTFKIRSIIKANSVLVFALSSSYIEIYNLGKLFAKHETIINN
jgi:hypothetical protein